jgi:hypothetical protein
MCPGVFWRKWWDVTDEVKKLDCGRTWRKKGVVISACVKGDMAYVVITAPNKYWPSHGKYMYTTIEAPREQLDLLDDALYKIGQELGISMKDVRGYIIDRFIHGESKKREKRRV